MAVQHCGSPPEVINVNASSFFHNDADNYYVIV